MPPGCRAWEPGLLKRSSHAAGLPGVGAQPAEEEFSCRQLPGVGAQPAEKRAVPMRRSRAWEPGLLKTGGSHAAGLLFFG
jgi:hypothetical protein